MHFVRSCICIALLFLSASPLLAEQLEVIAGAGPSTRIVQLFFKELPRNKDVGDYRFLVPEKSAKHRGGIINADNFLFGRTGRPLAQFEKSLGKREIFLARVPVAFVTGHGVPRVPFSMDDIRKIFLREIVNWKDFGGSDVPIELVGRERREAVFLFLKERHPFFKQVTFDRVFHRDDEVMAFLASPSGKYSIGFGAASNFDASQRVEVNDFNFGIEVGLVYDVVNEDHPIVVAARDFAANDIWKRSVRDAGMLPVD